MPGCLKPCRMVRFPFLYVPATLVWPTTWETYLPFTSLVDPPPLKVEFINFWAWEVNTTKHINKQRVICFFMVVLIDSDCLRSTCDIGNSKVEYSWWTIWNTSSRCRNIWARCRWNRYRIITICIKNSHDYHITNCSIWNFCNNFRSCRPI